MDAARENTRQTILKISIELFARAGYANVSVRDIANAVGIKPASLYYHFANKSALYLSAIEESFSEKAKVFAEVLQMPFTPEVRLEHYVHRLTELASKDEPFRRLMQRELLDGDEQRMRYLAEEVFQEQFSELGKLVNEIAPGVDPHMNAFSILSLVLHHLDSAAIRRFLPGYQPEHDDIDVIASHVYQLLIHGLKSS
jgi:AcrR family transcriptional regulator